MARDPKKYYAALMKRDPFVYSTIINSKGQKVNLVEHPVEGDVAEVIAMFPEKELAFDTGFWETDDMMSDDKDYEPSVDDDGVFYIGEYRHDS